MVGIHADMISLQVECILAELAVFQFILKQVGPTPDPRINDVRKTLTTSHLVTSRGASGGADGLDDIDVRHILKD